MTIKKSLYLKVTPFLLVLMVAFFSASTSFASKSTHQLGDVTLPDEVTIEGTSVPLQLNGMGYRTKFFFDIYVGALYTEKKVNTRDAVQALTGPKRIVMHMVYDEVSHKKMADAWQEGFEDNNSDEGFKKLKTRMQTFISYFPDLKAGDIVLLDYIPATGTRVTIDGAVKGTIKGADFNAALLDVWLGEEPADEGLREAMLGSGEEEDY